MVGRNDVQMASHQKKSVAGISRVFEKVVLASYRPAQRES